MKIAPVLNTSISYNKIEMKFNKITLFSVYILDCG